MILFHTKIHNLLYERTYYFIIFAITLKTKNYEFDISFCNVFKKTTMMREIKEDLYMKINLTSNLLDLTSNLKINFSAVILLLFWSN